MNSVQIRATDTPEILAVRAKLSANFAETYGERKGQEIEVQVRRIVEDAVQRVSMSRAVFRDGNVVNAALRIAQSPGEFDQATLEHPLFRRLVEQTVAEYPLVMIGATRTLTTQHMLEAERRMLALACNESGQHVLDEEQVRAAIQTKRGISEEQIAATIAATRSAQDVTVIEGTAGAGKSFTMEAVCNAYERSGYEVMGTAISWIASTVLGQSAKIKNCRAMTGLLNDMEASARKPRSEFFNRPTLLVVDEAGMVGTEQMAKLLGYCAASRYPVKVVLTGDSLQVMPIAAGAAMETIIAYSKNTRINTIRRQVLESHRTAVHRLSRREAGAALNIYVQQEAVRWARDEDDQVDMVVRAYLSYRLARPNGTALALATTNEAVNKINARLRAAYKRLGMIQQEEVEVTVTDTRSRPQLMPFSVGDEIVLRGNNKELPIYEIDPHSDPLNESTWKPADRVGVFNRNTGRIVGIRQAANPLGSYDFIVDLGGDTPGRVVINSETFHKGNNEGIRALPMVHNFATTIYGSQGQTVDQVFMLDSDGIDFRYAYVGASRHRENLTIFLNETDLHHRLDVQAQGKRRSAAAVRRPDQAKLKLGRYTRDEMLRQVAVTWARDSQNPTAMLYERRERLGLNRQEVNLEKLGEIRAPSRSESDHIWDADMRATVFSEVDLPLGMATSWLNGAPLDADSMITAVDNLRQAMFWLHQPDLAEPAQALLEAMNARRPDAGIWDLAGAEDLADQMKQVAQQCRDHLVRRPGLVQEILTRTQAGEPLSRAMEATVRVMTEALPVVDVEKILDMNHELKEAENVRQFEVDINRHALRSVSEVPMDMVDEPTTPTAATAAASPSGATVSHARPGFMGRLLAHFAPPAPAPEPQPQPAGVNWPPLRQPDVVSPFGVPDPSAAPAPAPKKAGKGVRRVFWKAKLDWLLRPPEPTREVPWCAPVLAPGAIAADGTLLFDNVPKTPVEGGAHGTFLQTTYGTWWGRGRLNEPRVFARDQYGEIVSRYRLDGTCVAGQGYPPMLRNPKASPTTPIYILPGAHEMAWLSEVKLRRAHETNDWASVPHMVWAAKDADWGPLAKAMGSRQVIIVRSKQDPTQGAWAAELQRELLERWRVRTEITPRLDPVATPTPPARDVVRPRVR